MKTIAILYETDCGGETLATKNIIAQFKLQKKFNITVLELPKLLDTSFIFYFKWIFFSIYRSLLFIDKQRPQTVYTTTFTAAFSAVITKKLYHHNVVFHYHGNRIPDFKISFSQCLKWLFTYFLHFLVFKCIDVLVVPSVFSKKMLERKHLESKNTHIIANGVNTEIFYRYEKSKVLKQKKAYNLDRKKIIISYIGRLVEKKGIEKILYLLPYLQKKYQIVLLLAHPKQKAISEKKYCTKLQKIIQKNKINSSVIFFENQNVTDIYNMSDLIVSFSEEENFPLVLLESYACQRPFVTSNPDVKKIQEELCNTDLKKLSWQYISKRISKLL